MEEKSLKKKRPVHLFLTIGNIEKLGIYKTKQRDRLFHSMPSKITITIISKIQSPNSIISYAIGCLI